MPSRQRSRWGSATSTLPSGTATKREVGAALKELFADGTVRREDLFVTTKLWNNNHRPERVKPALQASLHRLGLDAVDLYLVHTPFAFQPGDDQDPRRPAWSCHLRRRGHVGGNLGRDGEPLSTTGLSRAIGLSDIDVDGTREIIDTARIKPAVVEVESHPYHPQWELHELCKTDGIILLAFASLGHALEPRLLDDPLIVSIAQRLGKTPAQVLLAWGIQRGSAVLTGSVTPSRIRENFDVTALPESAIQEINERLETRNRFNSVVDGGEPGFAEVPVGPMTNSLEVVIAGAGPNGLMLACELGLAGIRPVVLDPMPGPNPQPRANRIVGQAARILDHRGLYSALTGTAEPPKPAPRSMFAGFPLDLSSDSGFPTVHGPRFNSGGLLRCLPSGPANTTRIFVGVTP